MNSLKIVVMAVVAIAMLMGCKKESTNTDELDQATGGVLDYFTSNVTIYEDGDYYVIESDGLPNHGSPYYTDSRYEAYSGSNPSYMQNPNTISEQSFTFRIPKNPSEASTKQSTSLGPMGISINGVPFFNQYAGPSQPLTDEINSFDQYNGHPQMTGQYHYHIEPLYLTSTNGRDGFLGFLNDGFPVYGPEEDGSTITNADLDEYHGHFGPTDDFPDGIYHYHITSEDPYINGSGFYGSPGTVTY